MKFIFALIASGASLVAAAWSEDMLQPRHHIGGTSGAAFYTTGSDGVTVDKIRVYKKTNLVGIKTWFSDGGTAVVGREEHQSQEYTFDSARNEVVTKMSLWGNGKGTRTGRVRFETSTGGSFDWGQNTDGQSEYPMEVGSGILVGWSGNANEEIDMLAPVFLKRMLKVYYDDVSYAAFDAQAGLQLTTLDSATFSSDNVSGGAEFGGSREFTSSVSWTKTSGTTLGFGASLVAGVPEVAQVEISSHWTMSEESQFSESKEWKRIRTLGRKPELTELENSTDIIKCIAEVSEGSMDLDWTGTLNLIVDAGNGVAGTHWKGQAHGRISSVGVSEVRTDCKLVKGSTRREHIGSPAARARQARTAAS